MSYFSGSAGLYDFAGSQQRGYSEEGRNTHRRTTEGAFSRVCFVGLARAEGENA